MKIAECLKSLIKAHRNADSIIADMKVTLEDCLALLSNCDKCPKEQCYYCRVLWDASIAGRLEDDMYFINCDIIQEQWERLKSANGLK